MIILIEIISNIEKKNRIIKASKDKEGWEKSPESDSQTVLFTLGPWILPYLINCRYNYNKHLKMRLSSIRVVLSQVNVLVRNSKRERTENRGKGHLISKALIMEWSVFKARNAKNLGSLQKLWLMEGFSPLLEKIQTQYLVSYFLPFTLQEKKFLRASFILVYGNVLYGS